MRRLALALLILIGHVSPALAQDDDGLSAFPAAATAPPKEGADAVPFSFRQPVGWKDLASKIDISGYLLPQFELVSIPSALPRDRTQYGAKGTRAGFAFYGTPWPDFTYFAHITVSPAGTENLTLLSTGAQPSVGFTVSTATQTSVDIEEASVGYRPTKWLLFRTGLLRVPFSLGQVTPIPEQMFPFRPPITGEFESGTDASLLATLNLFDQRLFVNAGVFLGTSLGALNPNETVRGPAFIGSVVAQPLGAMSMREGDENRGPFRFALGFGTIYRSAKAFDPTGYEASTFDDVRFAAWARASFKGVYVQGEYLRRLRTDDLSGRPQKSEGGYGEASYFQPIRSVGLGPILRAGVIQTSADFSPLKFTDFEGGLSFFPRGKEAEPEKLRIQVLYLVAKTSPLDEIEREGLIQLQLEF